jgi:aspartyl-tRNA(Asn)/glutamyl-tRNA(Gln) amidotransferase subunit A
VVGLKPTFGRVSTAGVFALAPSLDHVGPLARTAADARLLLDVLALDPVARPPVSLDGLRVAISADLEPVALAPAVARARDAALAALEAMGARVVEVAIPGGLDAYATFSPIQLAEALAVHRRAGLFPAQADRYGADVRARLEAAGDVGLDAYLEAVSRRRDLGEAFAAAFAATDVLLTPVSAGAPVRVGEHEAEHLGRRIAFRELVMGSTVPQDLTGLPACTVPAGFDDGGRPVGLQVTGPWREEHRVLCVAEALEAALPVPRIAPGA